MLLCFMFASCCLFNAHQQTYIMPTTTTVPIHTCIALQPQLEHALACLLLALALLGLGDVLRGEARPHGHLHLLQLRDVVPDLILLLGTTVCSTAASRGICGEGGGTNVKWAEP